MGADTDRDTSMCGAQHMCWGCGGRDWGWVATIHLWCSIIQLYWLAYFCYNIFVRLQVDVGAGILYMAVPWAFFLFFIFTFLCKYCSVKNLLIQGKENACLRIGVLSTIVSLYDICWLVWIISGLVYVFIEADKNGWDIWDSDNPILGDMIAICAGLVINLYLCAVCIIGTHKFNVWHWNFAVSYAKVAEHPSNMSKNFATPVPVTPLKKQRWGGLVTTVRIASSLCIGYCVFLFITVVRIDSIVEHWLFWIWYGSFVLVSLPPFLYAWPCFAINKYATNTVFNGIQRDIDSGTVLSPMATAGMGVTATLGGIIFVTFLWYALLAGGASADGLTWAFIAASGVWMIIAIYTIRAMKKYDRAQIVALTAQMGLHHAQAFESNA